MASFHIDILGNNSRTILDIIEYYEERSGEQVALLFLDAKKAFDNVKWSFLRQQIKYMEFGQKFLNVVAAIYDKQQAKILINDHTTNLKYKKERGKDVHYHHYYLS
uniref:Uncharacterized protein n=1 Tax=Micrurus carvalhoi TaxID=3147026 RepID=A0A2H6NCN0_9SAUR